MLMAIYNNVYHVMYDLHDSNAILWRAAYVANRDACPVDTQNQPGGCRAKKNASQKRDKCWWTVCRDQLKKEMAGLRAEADKVSGKCPALPV